VPEWLVETLVFTIFGAVCGAAVGCFTELFMLAWFGHDSIPVFFCVVAAGACAGLLTAAGPVVTSYARGAVGRK
jgi:H+/Cl- antiporter ClcA